VNLSEKPHQGDPAARSRSRFPRPKARQIASTRIAAARRQTSRSRKSRSETASSELAIGPLETQSALAVAVRFDRETMYRRAPRRRAGDFHFRTFALHRQKAARRISAPPPSRHRPADGDPNVTGWAVLANAVNPGPSRFWRHCFQAARAASACWNEASAASVCRR